MKPRVFSETTTVSNWSGQHLRTIRSWSVEFDDGISSFARFSTALRFAYHVAMGGDRWEFVA